MSFAVTAKTGALEALEILKENKDKFDIVITDVIMPDVDGFKLLELIRLETDIPVIMISMNGDPRNVVKGLKHGALDYLEKPVKIEDLRKLWEYVPKKPEYDHPPSSIETRETIVQSLPPEDYKEKNIGKEDEMSRSDQMASSQKKHTRKRISWTRELHRKFVDAIQQLQVDVHSKIIPTKILKIMDEPDLTRENVGSHLQKYRKLLMKQRETAGQDNNCIIDTNRTIRHFPDADFTASTSNTGRPSIIHSNHDGGYGMSNAGQMNPLSRYYARTGISDSFSANPISLNDLQFQQNLLHSQVMDQMQPAMPSPMLGNITEYPKLVADSCLQPETNRMEFQAVNSRGQIVNDYLAISPQIPYFGSGYQYPSPVTPLISSHPGHYNLPVMGIRPYSQTPNDFNHVCSPRQLSRGFPNQVVLNSQPDLLLEQVNCQLPGNFSGHFDAANMTTFGGQARSEMNESEGNKQIIPNDNQHNFSSQDNDLSAILNGF
ncbi:two-component response regulator ARR18-like [Forsythia ovata]|uniref:Two-component response regulator ARR18-like n=1 Tax=Forsythia ovata TaxID=205694 RepID=A0ABD1SJE0_9LAMI